MTTVQSEDYRASHQHRGAVYDRTIAASALDAHMDRWERVHLHRIVSRFYPKLIPRYLDFACGTGRITAHLAAHAVETYGVDVSESMLEVARARCGQARFMHADLTRGEGDLGLFDVVTAFRFFGNAQDELRCAALAAINHHLKPGGHLILNNHRNPQSFLGLCYRLGAGVPALDLSHAKLTRLLRRHGFEIVAQRAIGFWLLRFRLATAACLESAAARRLESAFQYARFAPFAPDALIVARKIA